ncbi:1,4-alpha-glucan branching protein GlgB [Chengkuizengella axinellae]|uniref:1,4-alpha-glucan branching enzyme GlgB n=1 Tax=Chengkuizengella axinellae TaxID=3064388 RepID=A0ABT9IYN8_9BACL|nr:1,4-alpha-glucan branching protein GlgB [Chengkuizengella sp. 2205SS18-9]MDP5273915.1 1,4-alpha-glucan branching protein GlgB [Chengkuizengella sp. 2205SS18-9]
MLDLLPTMEQLDLFTEGDLFQAYKLFGAHIEKRDGVIGVRFTVWVPNAKSVHVVGDFNGWIGEQHRMHKVEEYGVWNIFIPHLVEGDLYKYEIHTMSNQVLLKSDPYAFFSEKRPQTASIVKSLNHYHWQDDNWQSEKRKSNVHAKPMNIYEVHLGSWKKRNNEGLSYEQLADELVEYVIGMGYTHIELLPLMEHPYDRSWGYQITGYYSLTSRYGTPEQFMYFVDRCHQNGIGVILDWVPGHFCKDEHGLRQFDGTPLYEHEDMMKAEKPLWGTLSFDYNKPEVVSFLISNALFWMDVYHIDGFRVDAVASMINLNFDKPRHQHIKNKNGSTENLEALQFIKKLNETVFQYFPDALMMAEDSSDWPLVSAPTYDGGLGFNFKWNMGWMNDMLRYMETDSIFRPYEHKLITFSLLYAFSENYVLPFSHDEVVHGKKSMLNKMPGDYWQKFANLRLIYSYQMTHPGKKLNFMGSELAQFEEWKDLEQIDWMLLNFEMHDKYQQFVKELNFFYKLEPALWELDSYPSGFQWMDANNDKDCIISFIRKGDDEESILVICNFTALVHQNYLIGVNMPGVYEEIFNSDELKYGGSGQKNGRVKAQLKSCNFQDFSIQLTIPPLATIMFKRVPAVPKEIEGEIK